MSKKWLNATFLSFTGFASRIRSRAAKSAKYENLWVFIRSDAHVVRAGLNIRGCGPLSTLGFFDRLKAPALRGLFRPLIYLPYPEEMQYALPYGHIAGLGGYDYHGDGGGGGVPLTAAVRRAFWQTRRADTDCACPPVWIFEISLTALREWRSHPPCFSQW